MALVMTVLTGCGGEPEPADEPEASTAGVPVEVYFTHPHRRLTCHDVVAVGRTAAQNDPVTGALEALLAGPTEEELAAGYGGWFSEATAGMLRDVEVVDGTAHVVLADLRSHPERLHVLRCRNAARAAGPHAAGLRPHR